MITLREMAWEVLRSEADTEGGYTSLGMNADELATIMWDWNHPELKACGTNWRFILAAAKAALDEVEAVGWDVTRQRLRRQTKRRTGRRVSA